MLRYESAERESSRIVGALLARCSYLKKNIIRGYFWAMTNTGFFIPYFPPLVYLLSSLFQKKIASNTYKKFNKLDWSEVRP
jgi:hypothetical protein